MKPRFQIDPNVAKDPPPPAILVDPEAYDASEQQFAASLEQQAVKPKFVPDNAAPGVSANSKAEQAENQNTDAARLPSAGETPAQESDPASDQQAEDSDAWRKELKAKLNQYRTRKRPLPPRYPSLQLKFETAESSWRSSAQSVDRVSAAAEREISSAPDGESFGVQGGDDWAQVESDFPPPEPAGKVLEFPYLPPPPIPQNELAEPVFDQPPIMEAPELLPPPPVLGGILIEPPEQKVEERRPGIDLPLKGAGMPKRVLASLIDGFLVLLAGALFAYIFTKITSGLVAWRQAAPTAAGIV
ncbi:MAG: hypothetical protein JOZ80_10880, partial [Acidobacteriaceae bacterium]|nr:hypothetical protein [Acidobacteriaceae bacterium]